jgi:hypothetical protein
VLTSPKVDSKTPQHLIHRSYTLTQRDLHAKNLSVIGQLNYLAQNSRPYISFTVHQCARFSKEPKALYKKAVKRIKYYLQCTRDKPLIVKPKKTFHAMHTAPVTLLVYGTKNLHIYVIRAYHAHALSLYWMVSPYIG